MDAMQRNALVAALRLRKFDSNVFSPLTRVGFTKWSSNREPEDVFELLETFCKFGVM